MNLTGTADQPVIVDPDTLSMDDFNVIEHAHNQSGMCLHNRFGDKCQAGGKDVDDDFGDYPEADNGPSEATEPTLTMSELQEVIGRMKGEQELRFNCLSIAVSVDYAKNADDLIIAAQKIEQYVLS